jgi:hypothetical protein
VKVKLNKWDVFPKSKTPMRLPISFDLIIIALIESSYLAWLFPWHNLPEVKVSYSISRRNKKTTYLVSKRKNSKSKIFDCCPCGDYRDLYSLFTVLSLAKL